MCSFNVGFGVLHMKGKSRSFIWTYRCGLGYGCDVDREEAVGVGVFADRWCLCQLR